MASGQGAATAKFLHFYFRSGYDPYLRRAETVQQQARPRGKDG
jgi:hypothetical protein